MILAPRPGGPATTSGFSLRNVLGLQDEERKPSEVIAVEVRQQDNIDVRGLDLEPLHRDERGGAAVDEQALSVRLIGAHVDAGLEPPSAAEGVVAPQKPYVHFSYANPPESSEYEATVPKTRRTIPESGASGRIGLAAGSTPGGISELPKGYRTS